VNASAARKVFESQGFGAWSVFKSGAYKEYLPQAMRASAAPTAPALPPATAPAMAGVTQAGANLSAAQGALASQQQRLNELQTITALEQKYGAITDALSSQQEAAGNKLRDEVRYFELLKQGISPEIAKQRVELEATAAIEQEKLLAMEAELQAKIATLPVESSLRQELEKQVQAIEDRLNLQGQLVNKTLELADAERKAREEREKSEQRAAEIKELYSNIKGTIAEGIIGGIEATIEAAMTGADNLGDTLKGIASGVLKDIGSMLLRFGLKTAFAGFGFANGGIMTSSGPAPLKKYSQGGIAREPQLALYGERGPEAYVPLPDGRSIPVKMKQRDEALGRYRPIGAMGTMAADSEAAMSGGSAAGGVAAIDVRYSVERINNVEYVTAEQFRAGMQQAAAQGAQKGQQLTLRRLQQSPATRRKVGI
jgi:hypothetical protein